ncbi:MAG: bifunctional folylpolyglutamate synthase/dihydrofolate synthase, partial [Coprococcus sp.]
EKIAYEKAGIIKPGVPVIYFRRDEAAARVIEDTAKERGADIIPVEKSDYIINHLGNKTIDFSLHNRYYSYCNLQIQKTSLYQVENVSLAVTAFRMLM